MTDHQFKHWLAASDLTRLKLPRSTGVPNPVANTRRMRRRVIITGRRRVAERNRTRQVWSTFASGNYGIAVNIEGSIVAREIQTPGTIVSISHTGYTQINGQWVGLAGMTNPDLRLVFEKIAAAVHAWVAASTIRQEPKALTRLSEKLRNDKQVIKWKLGDSEPRELTGLEFAMGYAYFSRVGWEAPQAPQPSQKPTWAPGSGDS